MDRTKIMEIVEEKEKDREFLERCLSTNTCPKCGDDLLCEIGRAKGSHDYKCNTCGREFDN